MELKHIDFDKGFFEANGKKYLITDDLSVRRWREYEKMQITFAFGKDIKAINADLNLCFELCNKQKLADVAVLISNLNQSIVRNLDNRIHPAIEICCLFCNTEDENIAVFDPAVNLVKQNDWEQEGFDMQDFFTLACNKVQGFIEVYQAISLDISKKLGELSSLTDNLPSS